MKNTKNKIRPLVFLFVTLLFIQTKLLAQAYDPGRGMYVDGFALAANRTTLIPSSSILGNTPKEDSLFLFTKENHISYLALYGLNEVFQDDTLPTRIDTLLCSFISRARQNGIKKVGAIISSDKKFRPVKFYQNESVSTGNAWTFSDAEKQTISYPYLKFVENSYAPSDSLFESAYQTRLMLHVSRFNKVAVNLCDSTSKFDVLSLESEFWNPANIDASHPTFSALFDSIKPLMNIMASVREMYNSTSNSNLITEIYLGRINALAGLSQDTVIKYLDRKRLTTGASTPDSLPLFNRVLATYYHNSPDDSCYLRTDYHSRFLAYQNSSTLDSTVYFPLFSAGSIALGYSEDLFGRWFSKSTQNNLFAAERIWYDTALTDTTRATSANGNIIQRGAAMWYTYSSMSQTETNVSQLNHTHTFYSNSPLYLNNKSSDTIRFTYNGPLEKGIIYHFTLDTLGTNPPYIYSIIDTTINSNSNKSVPNLGNQALSRGNYLASLTLDYGNGVSYTYREKIVVDSSFMIWSLGDTTFCENGSVLLQSSILGRTNLTYKWYKNGAFFSKDTDFVFLRVTQSGNYFCRVQDSAGVTLRQSNTIHIGIAPNSIPTITIGKLSGPSATFLIASGTQQSGTTYLWSNGDDSKIAEVHYSDTYKVTITQPNGCHRSAKIKVDLNDFDCTNKGDTLIAMTSSQVTNYTITGNAVIRDTFVVDSSLTLNAANLTCQPGSKILVKNGATLSIENSSVLQSCGDTLWAGIEVEKGGEIISLTSNTISEARHGIQLNDSSNYKIEKTIFDNNYIGIYLTGMHHKIGNTIYNAGSTYDCLFKSTSPLLKKYVGMSETIGTKGLAGIYVHHGKMFINLNNHNKHTTFDNLSNGIIADSNSYMVTHFTKFMHIHADAVYNSLLTYGNGSGVFVLDNDPIYAQRVAANRSGKNFIDCDFGVYARNSSIDVKQTIMDSVMRGVYISALNPLKTHRALVTLNTINAINKGVSLIDADLSHATVVLGNEIKIGYFPSTGNETGIEINHTLSTFPSDTSLKIINNEIYCSNAAFGIHGQNATYSTIKGNFIKFDTNTADKRIGISLDKCKGSLIENNVVKGDYDTTRTDELLTGIRSSFSDSLIISCNQMDSTAFGFKFSSANTNSTFRANGMHSNKIGLYLDTSGSIGIQNHHGNLFNGKYRSYAAVNYGNVVFSEFDVYNDSLKLYYPAGEISPSSGWFVPDNDTNEYQCELTSTYIPYNHSGTGTTIWIGGTPIPVEDYQNMRVVANDSLQPAEFPDETQEIAEDELYQRLLQHPELLADPELNSFYLIETESALGQLTKLRLLQERYDPEIVQARNNLSSAEYYLNLTALALETNAINIEVNGETEALLLERDQLLLSLSALTDDYNVKYEIYRELFSDYLEIIENENAQVNVTSLIQDNEQIVNTVAFETIAAGLYTFNTAQKYLLESVATQCPKAGGKAVYRARAIYSLICDTIEYNDDANCAQQGFYRKKKEESKKKVDAAFNYLVKPNPAKDFLSVSSIPENSIVRIYNTQGLLVYNETSKASITTTINTASFANGIYYITIQNSNGIKTTKVSILH